MKFIYTVPTTQLDAPYAQKGERAAQTADRVLTFPGGYGIKRLFRIPGVSTADGRLSVFSRREGENQNPFSDPGVL